MTMSRPIVLLALVLCHWAIVHAGAERPSRRNLTKRSDDPSPLEAVVQTLSQQVTENNAKIIANNAKIASLEAQLNKAETSVAFHVEFKSDPVPLGPNAHLILDAVRTNAGNGYDVTSGYFRAPISGSYMFVVNYMGDIQTYVYVNIFVDHVFVDQSISHGSGSTWDHVSESLVVHLSAGQTVHLENGEAILKSIRGGHWSTFSGFLIQADP